VNAADTSSGRLVDDGTTKRRFALLDLLLDLKRNNIMSRTEVREQVDTFMFEVFSSFGSLFKTLI
jgi:hypothetical protein